MTGAPGLPAPDRPGFQETLPRLNLNAGPIDVKQTLGCRTVLREKMPLPKCRGRLSRDLCANDYCDAGSGFGDCLLGVCGLSGRAKA